MGLAVTLAESRLASEAKDLRATLLVDTSLSLQAR